MKKILTFAILLSLTACSSNSSNNQESKTSQKDDNTSIEQTFDIDI